MTAPDLTRITGLLLTKALSDLPELTDDDGERWSLSDDGGQHATLWRGDGIEWREAAHISLTVDVQPYSYVDDDAVVVGGVVYTGEEGVTA